MSVLVLRLAAPLQSWGAASRFTRRETENMPTKSGILGLLAAADGRRRSDPIEDMLGLQLAVRTEQSGVLLRDFHTAHHQIKGTAMPLTDRFYLSDAVFTAYIGGNDVLVDSLAGALENPAFPLFFGRRSCVPTGRIVQDVVEGNVAETALSYPWCPGYSGRRRARWSGTVSLPVQADSVVYPELIANRELNDVPISWDGKHRQYRSRPVVETYATLPTGNEDPAAQKSVGHDPLATLIGVQK
ncbi:type I-E CRISPR-associated protein Cas5/CasD [Tessaracoccus sp. OH4464_COT-324]|uniref:type I-E CRISPR-associated protein Cas5/CasD n=1 Tax=Tessaracoccus sp. OH4464_COT-324 TaxID=2491059 RepID=UPI000F63634F|nr:type I-E CRISPR-associated protein Cas5/CasD [Tessaracoccus sp. OH4464_COT-324]RRD45915.1 type I-E CRISPR-associated protein Cas5/CasD [Tessaracoccus sp. OH4464_COT-324]